MAQAISCGSWPSPITAELVSAKTLALGQTWIDGGDLYWTEGRPAERGRNALMRGRPGMPPEELLPPDANVRTRVHEYGGGAFAVFGGTVYFVENQDQGIHRREQDGTIAPLFVAEGLRHADLELDGSQRRLVCVQEDHRGDEVRNLLVAVPLDGTGAVEILEEGHDFYAAPRVSPDGARLAWLAWDHPRMPWEGTELWVADIGADGRLASPRRVAGGPEEAVVQPRWSPEGVLHFVSDRTGWWNLYRHGYGIEPLCPMEAEFGEPQWVFGQSTYAFLPEGRLLCMLGQKGLRRLARLDPATGRLEELPLPWTWFTDLRVEGEVAVFRAGSGTEPLSIVRLGLSSLESEVLRRTFEPTVDTACFSAPEVVAFPSEGGRIAHGFFYPPANPECAVPPGERPPLVVMSHGGPTSATAPVLQYGIQFWTSRGFAVLDVNYGGSTGYGRAYRRLLEGAWGVVDVDDCCHGALHMAKQGRVDGDRLAIRGGSAGGFTTLASLAFRKVFRAGTSLYGVGDLAALAHDTHKFESRYLDSLVGPYPARRDLYESRSAVRHAGRIAAPLLLLQGDEDPVVPPAQSQAMFQALKSRGIPVAYLLFQGEQHGFRQAANLRRALEAELFFYARVFGFQPADALPPVEIHNL